MLHMKLTSKRQATLPAETCDALGLKPGDVIELDPRVERGERLWLLRPRPARTRAWVGSLEGRVKPVTSHSMAAVRKSIAAAGRKGGRS
jgi:bifunctional DNA-binding transcriptional regulator/antitoxin component of YhaV-PrlF toxin-antitoxin module